MILFHNDYSEGCHEKVLEALVRTNPEQTTGYGEDIYCARAAAISYNIHYFHFTPIDQ